MLCHKRSLYESLIAHTTHKCLKSPLTLDSTSTQKAFSRFVGAIVETTRRMRAAGDLN
jgi:hypothetical protein